MSFLTLGIQVCKQYLLWAIGSPRIQAPKYSEAEGGWHLGTELWERSWHVRGLTQRDLHVPSDNFDTDVAQEGNRRLALNRQVIERQAGRLQIEF